MSLIFIECSLNNCSCLPMTLKKHKAQRSVSRAPEQAPQFRSLYGNKLFLESQAIIYQSKRLVAETRDLLRVEFKRRQAA